MNKTIKLSVLRILAVAALVTAPVCLSAQELEFTVHADPVISWMGSNESEYRGEGAKAGFDIGLNVLHFFADNYAISSGLSFLSAGGRQSTDEEHTIVFTNFNEQLDPGTEVRYNIHYLNIPAGIRLQPDQVGYLTYFTDLGFDIRMRIKSTIDVPALDIRHENARNEVYGLNAGWHIGIGIEYELAIDASIVAGLGYAQDFFDITKDLEDASQLDDRSGIRMVKIRLGFKF
ncbi:MAG: porin family protein [Bacteroidales bacterium]|nr:porin family protein [Bacteroidales bacterium]MDT8373184.1 porin family protein [Bacteroidales bacterium]